MAKFVNPTKVITGVKPRWSYANVWQAKSIKDGDGCKKRYPGRLRGR